MFYEYVHYTIIIVDAKQKNNYRNLFFENNGRYKETRAQEVEVYPITSANLTFPTCGRKKKPMRNA